MKKKEKLRLKIATKLAIAHLPIMLTEDYFNWDNLIKSCYLNADLLISSSYLPKEEKPTGRIVNPNRTYPDTSKHISELKPVNIKDVKPEDVVQIVANEKDVISFEEAVNDFHNEIKQRPDYVETKRQESKERLETEKAVKADIKNELTEKIANSELQAKFLSLLNHPCFTQTEKDKAIEKSKTYDDAAYRRAIDWINAKKIERITDNSPVNWDWNLSSQLVELAKHKKLTPNEKKAVKAALEECTIAQGKNILLDYNNRIDSRK